MTSVATLRLPEPTGDATAVVRVVDIHTAAWVIHDEPPR